MASKESAKPSRNAHDRRHFSHQRAQPLSRADVPQHLELGPDDGEQVPFEVHIAGKWHVTMPPETNSNDFRGFWNKLADSNSIFFVAKFFFERFEFLVCSCECAVACLCPRNSISNVVASVTIHDDMKIIILICK